MGRRGAAVSWILILASVAGILAAGYLSAEQHAELAVQTSRVILVFQAKILHAASRIYPEGLGRELEAISRTADVPGMAPAVAALYAGLSDSVESGDDRALEILDRPGNAEDETLRKAVRNAIVHGDELPPEDAVTLARELGWLGRLLATRNLPDESPEREAMLQEARRAATVTFLFVAAALGGVIVGVGFLIVAILSFASGRLAFRRRQPEADAGVYLQAFAVYLATIASLGLGSVALGLTGMWTGIGAVALGSVLGVAWPALRRVPWRTARRDLGLHEGTGWAREAACGLAGYVAILPLVAVGVVTTVLLGILVDALLPPVPGDPPRLAGHPALVWLARGSTLERLAVLFLASGFAPFFEETLFRGALLSGSRRSLGVPGSILVMAFLFAVIHPQGLVTIPALGALAVGFGILREWRGSLIAPMTAHALHNGILVGFMWAAFG